MGKFFVAAVMGLLLFVGASGVAAAQPGSLVASVAAP
jgi:hypothetical protein